MPQERSMDRSVVLIEDDPFILEGLKTLVELLGYTAYTAADGIRGVELVRKYKPSAVISDIAMPGMNGLEVIRELKADPSTTSIPVVVLSAKAAADERKAGLDAGAVRYITKPVRSDVIADTLQEIVALSE
jgi:CheY-like chemotaxis protein